MAAQDLRCEVRGDALQYWDSRWRPKERGWHTLTRSLFCCQKLQRCWRWLLFSLSAVCIRSSELTRMPRRSRRLIILCRAHLPLRLRL